MEMDDDAKRVLHWNNAMLNGLEALGALSLGIWASIVRNDCNYRHIGSMIELLDSLGEDRVIW